MYTNNKTLTTAIRRILRPLVRILLRNGIASGSREEMGHKAYVGEAFAQAKRNTAKATISSISAETGLSHKEVQRLTELDITDSRNTEQKYNRAIRVISGWLNDPRFACEKGNPRALSLDDSDASFAILIKEYSGDIPTWTMLNMLQTSEYVEVKDGRVHLVRNAYVPGHDPEEIIRILGKDTSQLINTIDHNLTTDQESKWFQRKVSNPRVRADALAEFKEFSRKRSRSLLEELDAWLGQNESNEESVCRYASMSVFHYQQYTYDEV